MERTARAKTDEWPRDCRKLHVAEWRGRSQFPPELLLLLGLCKGKPECCMRTRERRYPIEIIILSARETIHCSLLGLGV